MSILKKIGHGLKEVGVDVAEGAIVAGEVAAAAGAQQEVIDSETREERHFEESDHPRPDHLPEVAFGKTETSELPDHDRGRKPF